MCVHTIIGHRCDVPGCGQAIVIDGNMKNYRDVCFAVNAGYVEYKGLPGRVRSGCQNTPQYMSRYCGLHNPVVAIPQNMSLDDNDPTPSKPATKEDQVGLIVNKRVTRRSTLYEVRITEHTIFSSESGQQLAITCIPHTIAH